LEALETFNHEINTIADLKTAACIQEKLSIVMEVNAVLETETLLLT
jgi:hypothetical protein